MSNGSRRREADVQRGRQRAAGDGQCCSMGGRCRRTSAGGAVAQVRVSPLHAANAPAASPPVLWPATRQGEPRHLQGLGGKELYHKSYFQGQA